MLKIFQNNGKYINHGLLLLRILMGFMLFLHGFLKFTGGNEQLIRIGSAVEHIGISTGYYYFGVIAALLEMIGGVLFMLGFLHNLACVAICSVLAVAVIMRISVGAAFPAVAYPLEIFFLFFAFLFIGPGKFSIDNKFK
jgi:putative oxidoreductase